jgi:hypothetical protein
MSPFVQSAAPAAPQRPQNPLQDKVKGHCIASFGPGGTLLLVRPKRQDWFERDPQTGKSRPVQKVSPGPLAIHSLPQVLGSSSLFLKRWTWFPFLNLSLMTQSSSSLKKTQKELQDLLKKHIQDSEEIEYPSTSKDNLLLWKILIFML